MADGDTLVADLVRTDRRRQVRDAQGRHGELGSPGNPPGFDANLVGLNAGDQKTFDVDFPAEYPVAEMAGTKVDLRGDGEGVRRRVLPELDDEFAKDLGDFESLAALTRPRACRPDRRKRAKTTPARCAPTC